MKVPVPTLYSFVGISNQEDPSTIETHDVFKAEIDNMRELDEGILKSNFYTIGRTCVMVSVCFLLLCDEKSGGNFHLKEKF